MSSNITNLIFLICTFVTHCREIKNYFYVNERYQKWHHPRAAARSIGDQFESQSCQPEERRDNAMKND